MKRALSLVFIVSGCGGASPAAPVAPPSPPPGAHAARVSATPPPADTEGKLRWAIAGEQRSAENRARDKYRHPFETLTFFGLRDDMTVIELWPGAGWYTEILAPVLAQKGKLVVTGSKTLAERMPREPEVFGKVEMRRLDPPNDLTLGPDESADLVLTFRNLHNWMKDGYDEKLFAAIFKVLKHGGVLGFEEHRAKPGTDPKTAGDIGYVPESYVLALAQKTGFELAGKSEINANPKDTKDHQGGVWALPPTLTNGEQGKNLYLSIGESDRMTLKFVKK
jgi:predicted methyltransferase